MKRFLLVIMYFSFILLSAQNNITVISYNIHHGEGLDGKVDIKRIADLIISNKADLVALQEVDRFVERTAKIDIIDSLAKLTQMNYSFYKNITYQGGDYGNAILSKFPILSDTNLHYTMLREGEQRGLLQAKLLVNSDTLIFMNTHIDYREDDSERVMNVDEITKLVSGINRYPIILCGDFNDTPESRTISKVRELFTDVFNKLNLDTAMTYPSEKPVKKIDYIFTRDKLIDQRIPLTLEHVCAKVIQSGASDHLPIMAKFILKK